MDLHTARIDDARVFYEALLGWTFRNRFVLSAVPDQESETGREQESDNGLDNTVMALSNDQPVADLVERSETFDDMALLSTWFPYVYVDDLEATLALVEPAGGLILNPPARRGTVATVATILDPSDALLCLWEPIGVPQNAVMHQPGAFAWIELESPDLDSSKKFYGELFGWDAGEVSVGREYDLEQNYTVFTKQGERVAGAVESPMAGIPASWCPSFAVADVDIATIVAARNGGVLMAEPADIPVGRQAVIVDPTGAAFSVLGPKSRGPRPL
ncbi:MAG: VOC family protein [Acidimicrobiales bacterium]